MAESFKSSKSHLKSHQFEPYNRVQKFIKSMQKYRENIKYKIVDHSQQLTEKFKSKTPNQCLTSILPSSPLSTELDNKTKLVEAYHNLTKIKKKVVQKNITLDKVEKKFMQTKRLYSPSRYNRSIAKLLNTSNNNQERLFLTEQLVVNSPKANNRRSVERGSDWGYYRAKECLSNERDLSNWSIVSKKLEISSDHQKTFNDSSRSSAGKNFYIEVLMTPKKFCRVKNIPRIKKKDKETD